MKIPSPDRSGGEEGISGTEPIIINLDKILVGENLDIVEHAYIQIENGVITDIENTWSHDGISLGGIATPLPVNAHVHLNDYVVPEACIGLDLASFVGSKGIKLPLTRLNRHYFLDKPLKESLNTYYSVADFQEHKDYCRENKELVERTGAIYLGFSRPSNPLDPAEYWEAARLCGGIGVSNPLRLPPHVMEELHRISQQYPVSAHVSETEKMEERGSLHYLLNYRIKMTSIVHGVFLKRWELRILAEENIPLVVCPRSNIWFVGRTADIPYALTEGVTIAIGTDNAGCFHPDIFAEMELLFTIFRNSIDPYEIVRMAFINGYIAVGIKPRHIDTGQPANILILREPRLARHTWNVYGSIIRRARYCDKIILRGKSIVKSFN